MDDENIEIWTKSVLYTPVMSNEPATASVAGKKVARTSILHSCVNKYAPPAWTHFQNALYSALEKRGIIMIMSYDES